MAGRVLHQSSTWPDAGCGVWRSCPRVGTAFKLFFFFFLGFASTRLQFTPNRADSARIGLYQPVIEMAEICLKSCWNSRNQLWMRPKYPKSVIPQFYYEYLLLLLCCLFWFVFLAFFFLCFVNQGHSNVFFKNILIVKIYIKYKYKYF